MKEIEQIQKERHRVDNLSSENNKNDTSQTVDNAYIFEKSERNNSLLDLDYLAQSITHNFDGGKTNYYFRGDLAFFDYGDTIRMASESASKNDEMVLISLQTAITHHKNGFEIVGSEEFKQKSLELMVKYNLTPVFTNQAQQDEFDKIKLTLREIQIESLKNNDTIPQIKDDQTTREKDDNPIDKGKKEIPCENVGEQNKHISTTQNSMDKKVRGEFIEKGSAPYQFKAGNKETPYIVLNTNDLKEPQKTLWGVDFPRAIAESGVKVGDIITVEHLGKQPVMVKVPLRDIQTDAITGFQDIHTERNAWKIEPIYPKQTQVNPDCVIPRDFMGYDVLSVKDIHENLCVILRNAIPDAIIHEPKPQEDFIYFYPDGKPVPNEETKPITPPTTPETVKITGTIIMQDIHKDNIVGLMVAAKAGFCQGLLKDPKDDSYHPIIAPICHKPIPNLPQFNHNYLAFTALSGDKPEFIGSGNIDGTGKNLKYKTKLYHKEIRSMTVKPEIDYKDGFQALFMNDYPKHLLHEQLALQAKAKQDQKQAGEQKNENKPK